MDGSPAETVGVLCHPPWPASTASGLVSGFGAGFGTQMAAARSGAQSPSSRRVMSSSSFAAHHQSSLPLPPYPVVYNPPTMSTAAPPSSHDAVHHHEDYYPPEFPFDTHELPAGNSFGHDLFPSSTSASFWPSHDKAPAQPLSPLSLKRDPPSLYSPSNVPLSVSGRFYESSARYDDAPAHHPYPTHHTHASSQPQHQHQQHQQQVHNQQHHAAAADYANPELSPLQAHHVAFYTPDTTPTDAATAEPFPTGHRQAHRRHPSSGSGVVPADFFAPPPQAYIEPAELDYASPSAPPPRAQQQFQHPQQHQQQQSAASHLHVPFPTTDSPSPPEYGSSPGLTEDADDSVESDAPDEDDDGEYDPAAPTGRRRRRSTLSSSAGYSDAGGAPPARRRRVGRAAAPVPVPNLTKKSRGRRVPTAPVLVTQGGVQKDLRTYCCIVAGCGKRFARGEHLKRHVRSIHTNEKPHKCPAPGCGKEFSRHDNLGQHMRVHKSYRADY